MTNDTLPPVAVRMVVSGSIESRSGLLEMDRAYLKRPGRGVPPPRSGPTRLTVLPTQLDLFEETRQSYPQPDGRWSVDPGAPL